MKEKYPASHIAHWVTGPVPCCKKHCEEIVRLGDFTGSVVAISKNLDENLECSNCKSENENKK